MKERNGDFMRRTHFVRAVVCAAVFSLMLGTTAFAGTVTRSAKVRGVTSYTDTYTGAYGYYCAASNGSYSTTTALNNCGYIRYYNCSVSRYNYSTRRYDLWDDGSKPMDNGESTSATIVRSKNSYVYNYEHNVKAYDSPTGTPTTLVDKYTYTAKQYYEN